MKICTTDKPSMNDHDPNKKHYFEQGGKFTFESDLIALLKKEKVLKVTVWVKGEDVSSAETYNLSSYNQNEHSLELRPLGLLQTKIHGSKNAGQKVLIKIPINTKKHYFTGGILVFNKSDLSYKLILDLDIYKSQARSSNRIEVSGAIKINLQVSNKVYDAKDLSIGGISILVRSIDVEKFVPKSIIRNSILTFNRQKYEIPEMTVLSLNEITLDNFSNKMIKIGLSFNNLPLKIRDELYIQISTETQGQKILKDLESVINRKS